MLACLAPNGVMAYHGAEPPRRLCVGTVHVGHYKFSYRAYLILLEWIENSAYRITGPPMECYLLDPCNTINPNHYITRILFPIELKDSPQPPTEPAAGGETG